MEKDILKLKTEAEERRKEVETSKAEVDSLLTRICEAETTNAGLTTRAEAAEEGHRKLKAEAETKETERQKLEENLRAQGEEFP